MLFSNVKTPVVDSKQQRAPTSILKRGTKADVGNVVMPPAGLPSEMVSDEKPFQRRPMLNTVILHLGGPRRLTPISTRATMTRRRHEIVARLKMVLTWDYMTVWTMHLMSLSSVVALWTMMGIFLRRRLPHSQPPDRSGAGADARFASQDARRRPQDPRPVSDRCNNNATMGSSGFGGGSSDDSNSDSSSGRESARHNVSSRRRRPRKQRRSKGRSDPPWDHFGDRDKFSHRKSKRQIESVCHRKGFVKGTTRSDALSFCPIPDAH
jgi:hypothetical protein